MALGRLLKPVLARIAPGAFIYRGNTSKSRGVAITFDDGPAPGRTEELLEILERRSAKACFFLQGQEAEKHPAIVRAIYRAGHELGNHGYGHHRPRDVGTPAYVGEAIRTQAILEDCVGESLTPLFRPPYGTLSVGSFIALARKGYRFVHWSIDSNDSFLDDPGKLAGNVRNEHITAGDILLFHDDQPHTIKAMPAILDHLAELELECIPVRDLAP